MQILTVYRQAILLQSSDLTRRLWLVHTADVFVCESSPKFPDGKYCRKIRPPISSVSSGLMYWLYWRMNDTRRLKSVRNSGRTIAVQLYRAAKKYRRLDECNFPANHYTHLNVGNGFHRTKNSYKFANEIYYFESRWLDHEKRDPNK